MSETSFRVVETETRTKQQVLLLTLLLVLLVVTEGQEVGEEVEPVTTQVEEESFTNTKEFKAIMGGVAGFWGGVFSMGSIYLLMVFAKRVFNPEEADDKGGD